MGDNHDWQLANLRRDGEPRQLVEKLLFSVWRHNVRKIDRCHRQIAFVRSSTRSRFHHAPFAARSARVVK